MNGIFAALTALGLMHPASQNIEDRREANAFLQFSVQLNERANPMVEAKQKIKSVFEHPYDSTPLSRAPGEQQLRKQN